VVVDNDDIADKIITVMNKEKSGRVTFIPLNKLKSDLPNYPKAHDALPMISKLRYDKKYNMAMNQVFGRTIICEDLATAAQYTRSHGLNAVTVEGDRADRKGTLTGGFHDVRRNRMDSAKLVKKWRETYETDSTRHQEVKNGIKEIEQKITHIMGQINVLDAKRRQIVDRRGMMASQGNSTAKELEFLSQRVARLGKALDQAQAEYKDASAKRQSYEEELKTPMRQELTAAELKTLEALTKDQEKQKAALIKASETKVEVSHNLAMWVHVADM
jgi:structural maintenance of chromosome 3 (chondroitin sulfate proteoglycan 6)